MTRIRCFGTLPQLVFGTSAVRLALVPSIFDQCRSRLLYGSRHIGADQNLACPQRMQKEKKKRHVLGFNRHETGHFLSGEDPPKHDNGSKDNLMYEDQPYGAFLPKDRILRWFPNLDE
jgi:hypothetical protein